MVCTNCKRSRLMKKQGRKLGSDDLVCLYQVSAVLPSDLMQTSPLKKTRADSDTIAAWRKELRSLWKPLPARPPRRIKKMNTCMLDDRHLHLDDGRPTSPKGALLAQQERSARTIQSRYRAHARREKFRKWVNLAMNTDKGRNRCARKMQSVWRMAVCKWLYQQKQAAAKVLRNFLRLIHGRRLAMRRALRVLYTTLHRMAPHGRISSLYTAVATTKKSRDLKRVQRAVEYIASEGHGHVNFSVLGALRLSHQLEKTESRLKKKRRATYAKWVRKGRPASWNAVVVRNAEDVKDRPASPMSKWFAAQRDRRARANAQDAVSLHARHQQVINRRRRNRNASVVRATSPSRFDGREKDKSRLSPDYLRNYAVVQGK
jgi:hypothetical protein